MDILRELQEHGLINKFALKYNGLILLFIIACFFMGVFAAIMYAYDHETALEEYVAAHLESHYELQHVIERKLDGILKQVNEIKIDVAFLKARQ